MNRRNVIAGMTGALVAPVLAAAPIEYRCYMDCIPKADWPAWAAINTPDPDVENALRTYPSSRVRVEFTDYSIDEDEEWPSSMSRRRALAHESGYVVVASGWAWTPKGV